MNKYIGYIKDCASEGVIEECLEYKGVVNERKNQKTLSNRAVPNW